MSTSNFCIAAGMPMKLGDLSLQDKSILKLGLPDQVQQIDLHDVLTVEPGWSMTLAGGFLPLPDLVNIAMRDGSQHQFSVGLFGVLFGHRGFWGSHLNRALGALPQVGSLADDLLQLSKAVSERPRVAPRELVPVRASQALASRTSVHPVL
jgi:hypothetical protein